MSASLVGSEMCIRDRWRVAPLPPLRYKRMFLEIIRAWEEKRRSRSGPSRQLQRMQFARPIWAARGASSDHGLGHALTTKARIGNSFEGRRLRGQLE
eukprot:13089117-Alexandrium_andersonii.AAC.1